MDTQQCAVVRECSGLVLDEDDNWRIACQGFPRLFHYTEDEVTHPCPTPAMSRIR